MNEMSSRRVVAASAVACAILLLASAVVAMKVSAGHPPTRTAASKADATGGQGAKGSAGGAADGSQSYVGESRLDPPIMGPAEPDGAAVGADGTGSGAGGAAGGAVASAKGGRSGKSGGNKHSGTVPGGGGAADVPDGAGGGNPASFAFSSKDPADRPARWDPCTGIRWGFNPDQAPAGSLDLVKQAIGRLASASGLKFSYAGTTGYKPLKQPETAPPDGIDAVVAFGNGSEYSEFAGGTFGLGGFTSQVTPEGPRILRGGVALNSRLIPTIPDGFGPGQRRGGALLHEMGHMVGLAHVGDQGQLMFAALTPKAPSDYGAGDRNGLAKVGAPAGCFTAPPPPTTPTTPPPPGTPPTTTPAPPNAPPPPTPPAAPASSAQNGEIVESWTYCHLSAEPAPSGRGAGGSATRRPA